MPGLHVKFDVRPEEFLSHLADAAYRVAIKRGFKGSFLDFELELYKSLREVIKKDMVVADLCGLFTVCQESDRYEPWSKKSDEVYRDFSATID